MINKQREAILQGQISIFDLEFNHPKETKKEFPKTRQKVHDDKFTEIINQYSSTAARIVKQVCGALLVEVEDKTLYFNPDGAKELELKKDMELMPADEILVVNQDREVNKLQLGKLEDMHATQYIKRKGDANIIIQFPGKCIVINPRGWVLEYLQKPKYHDNELFITEMIKESTDLVNYDTKEAIKITKSANEVTEFENDENEIEDFQIGDKVEFYYCGNPQVGIVVRIYNKNETVNVTWEDKHTAFYYKSVKKIS